MDFRKSPRKLPQRNHRRSKRRSSDSQGAEPQARFVRQGRIVTGLIISLILKNDRLQFSSKSFETEFPARTNRDDCKRHVHASTGRRSHRTCTPRGVRLGRRVFRRPRRQRFGHLGRTPIAVSISRPQCRHILDYHRSRPKRDHRAFAGRLLTA